MNASAKTSQVFSDAPQKSSQIFDTSPKKTVLESVTSWSFHPLYSIFMKEAEIPRFRKLLQMHFSMSTLLLFNAIFGGLPIVFIVVFSLVISWFANYVFGFIIGRLMKAQTTFSMCGKIFGVFLYFLAFFIVLLIVATFSDSLMTLILALIEYVLEWIVFDSIVVAIVGCNCSTLRKWFSVRGFSQ